MVDVYLPRSLVTLFPGLRGHVTVEAGSVQEVIERLDQQWPGVRFRLCGTATGERMGRVMRDHINIFVDGERADVLTPLRPDAEVRVITAVSGG